MIEKSLHSIEYDKILAELSGLCVFAENKESVLKMRPLNDARSVKDELTKTDTMMTYIYQYSEPRLDSAKGAGCFTFKKRRNAVLCGIACRGKNVPKF